MSSMPHQAPPSPSSSSDSDGSNNSGSTAPHTPVTQYVMPTFMNYTGEDGMPNLTGGGVKRTAKTIRRVNTAERRATHNAVERQRRETLNGRFMDLAGLLSNLSQMRRPSKSAIVNSSIAHLNASRRHRTLGAAELRGMKSESDALRNEVNEWRSRAGMPLLEEPARSDAFGLVLSGELEFEPGDMLDGNGEEGEQDDEEIGGVYDGSGRYAAYHPEQAAHYAALGEQHRMAATMQHAQAPYVHTPALPVSRVAYHGHPSAHYYDISSPTIVTQGLAPGVYENPAASVTYEAHREWETVYDKQPHLLQHPGPRHAGQW